ncbi:MAG: efflux RND transporter periplasmic adaptor subunit [Campylobacteraceae bacterium]|nr:efflux RND transporter periplasmic adaptor subunit [Campylobacteraceae bacterium]
MKKNDVLYKIDPSTYQAQYNEAKAILQSAKADVVSTEQKYKRYQELLEVDGVSQQAFDDVNAEYLKSLALVEQRKAQLENAEINLDRTNVRASIEGHIGISSVTRGALVTANQANALATIRYTNRVYVDLSQSSAELLNLKTLLSEENIKKGSADVAIVLIDGKKYDKNGTLQLQEISVDEGTGAVTLRAEFENKEGVLLSGMYVRASVEGAIKEDSFLIPQQAVLRDTKANPIITVAHNNGSVETKIVTIQRAVGNRWVVTDGVSENDKIIIEGLNKINSRSQVSIVDLTNKYIEQ